MTVSNDVEQFVATLDRAIAPEELAAPLRALWYEAKGDWAHAHSIVQADGSTRAARVHAYLHRKEGDTANARYWYGRAGVAAAQASLDEEWRNLVACLLDQSSGASEDARTGA